MTRRREGGVLGMIVVLLVALQLLAHGSLMTASLHLRSAEALAQFAQANRAARVVVLEALGGPLPEGAGEAPRGGRVIAHAGMRHGLWTETRWTRLSSEQWLVEGAAGRSPRPPHVTAATVVWSPDPVTRVGAFGATVEVAESVPVRGLVGWEPLPEPDPRCGEWNAALAEVTPGGGLVGIGSRDGLPGDGPGFGPLSWGELRDRSAVLPGAAGTPGPEVRFGLCVPGAPWNFGDPAGDGGPCADHFVLAAAPGSLTLGGGVGQGMLTVRGDLTLSDDAYFEGVLVVGGALRLTDGSTFRGLAVAAGGVDAADDARIVGSSCSAVRALAAVRPRLGRPAAVAGSGWITLP